MLVFLEFVNETFKLQGTRKKTIPQMFSYSLNQNQMFVVFSVWAPAEKVWKANCGQSSPAWCAAVCECYWHTPPPKKKKNHLISYWYEAFIAVGLWLGAQWLGSGLDWHGNWHRSSLALSRLDPWGNYLPFRHIRNAWDLWHRLSGRLHDFTRNNLDIWGIPGNGRSVPIGWFHRAALCF